MESLLQDLRHAARGLRRARGFTFVALAALALGIGANTAVFSVIRATLFTTPPFEDPGRLVMLTERATMGDPIFPGVSFADYEDWRASTRAFDGMGWFTWTRGFNLTGGDAAERVGASLVTHELLALLGTPPALGRTFGPDDDRAGAPPTLLLSASLWRERFGADPDVLGRTVRLDGSPWTVIGVMPDAFTTGGSPSVWLPARRAGGEALLDRTARARNLVIGRLRPGTDRATATADVARVARDLAAAYPDTNGRIGVRVEPFSDWLHGEFVRPMRILLGVVVFVLLIACANVANLLLSRMPGRARELAVRASLGATRARLVRLVLAESLLLALAGGAVGALLALWGVDLMGAALPSGYRDRIATFTIDGPVIAATIVLSMLTSLVFGLLPAIRGGRVPLRTPMTGTGTARRGGRLRNGLVVAEVSLALILLVGAGLLLRNFLEFRALDLGFVPDNVLTFRTNLPDGVYPQPTQLDDFRTRVMAALAREPGVAGVAAETRVADNSPIDRGWGFETDGRTPAAVEAPPLAAFAVSPGYFGVKGTRVLRGRAFTAADRAGAAPVAIVNEELARRFWPDGSAVGRAIRLGDATSGAEWHTVVGVIEDVRQPAHTELTEIPSSVYLPIAQNPSGELLFLVRTSGEPLSFAPGVRRIVATIDPDQPVQAIRTMRALLRVEAFDRAAMAAL
ncbi:MAG: ADOP family duplicated permease, partial [Gemmatimonadota bacterium]